VTEFSVFSFRDGLMILEELVEDLTLAELKEITPAHYVLSKSFRVVQRPKIFTKVNI
jgi:hypothetical protein